MHGHDQSNSKIHYSGPEFDEYCISVGGYLPATRDRSPCSICPLGALCDAGLEEQIRRVARGENPSLTEGCSVVPEQLERDNLFAGLSQIQVEFLIEKIPQLSFDNKVEESNVRQSC